MTSHNVDQYQIDTLKAFDDWAEGKDPEYAHKVLTKLQDHHNIKHTNSGYNDAQLNILYTENVLKRCMRTK